jgi:hypothetical protein
MTHLWYRLLPADNHKSIFENKKKCCGTPGESDPLLGLLDEQVVDEVPCRGAGRCQPAAVRGEPQRLLDDVAEPSRRRGAGGRRPPWSHCHQAGGRQGGEARALPHPSHHRARRSSCHHQACCILAIAAVGWRLRSRAGWSPRLPLPSLAGLTCSFRVWQW